MYITRVITYADGWQNLTCNYPSTIDDIISTLDEIVPKYYTDRYTRGHGINYRDSWHELLENRGWTKPPMVNNRGRKVSLRNLGPIKSGTSVSYPFNGIDFFTKWLFNVSVVALRNEVIEIPIYLTTTSEFQKISEGRSTAFRDNWDNILRQLESLSPLNYPFPFVVLGFDMQPAPLQVFEIESSTPIADNRVIDRSIEFPAEYHVAGLNILNFFGTYLREQYPEEDAKVRIEQDGLIVRLIVESNDGRSEVIEKALHEYQLIVTGQEPPESIIQNEKLVYELRNELRFAKLRIETQQDLISLHKGNIDKLYNLVAAGLENKANINIEFNPVINTSQSFTVNQEVSNMLSDINQLKSLVATDNPLYKALKELEDPLIDIQKQTDPNVVKDSTAMNKIKDLINKVSEGGDTIEKSLALGKKGWEIFKGLAGNYNKVAQWCGLPVVPTIFTK